jgi:proteasome lid subunit RPN8/RPN11
MTLKILTETLQAICSHVEKTYPEEGAGFLLGRVDASSRIALAVLPVVNARENTARHNRYLITPQDMLQGELEAEKLGLDIIGIFHSHPDHPNAPSEFDRDWALPWYSYLITSVLAGRAAESRSWRLVDDRSTFEEESLLEIEHDPSGTP